MSILYNLYTEAFCISFLVVKLSRILLGSCAANSVTRVHSEARGGKSQKGRQSCGAARREVIGHKKAQASTGTVVSKHVR